jgi:hypothetical protein
MRRATQLLLGSAVLLVLYLFFISTIEPLELVLGAGLAVLCTIAGMLGYAAMETSWELRRLVTRELVHLPAAVLTGTAAFIRLVALRVSGGDGPSRFQWTAIPGEPGDLESRGSATIRGVTLAITSFAPSTYVVDAHLRDGVLLHRIDEDKKR